MSLHAILETLIHHTTFRTEDERHEALELLDSTIDHDPPTEASVARTSFRPPPPTDASGNVIQPPPPAMTADQAAELISLLKSQQTLPPAAAVPPGVTWPPGVT